ncbi:glycoside hydrolase family 3 [Pelomonas sp. Root1217]|uniref:glycoside hydrolase family 3 C-terminal domain-containing protein n=1 Tax=Pelomonas sp. Root1217 TaxID=1736430 RepID=UPI00070B49FA|nr:glycoside hydrolase family 3 C-terminal domain-containing protein [Pelomonas sp. Root1217]KQV59578.1 glycoside hydrolase family 3 [Pelomonas sp. Root1217]
MTQKQSIHKLRTATAMAATSLALACASGAARAAEEAGKGLSPLRQAVELKAAAIVARMTPDEKIEQLLNVAPAIPRLRIPGYGWWTESLHGAMGPVPTTNFPQPIGLAASFDADLVKEVASTISREMRALRTLGKGGGGLNTWAPNINIFRDPRWGRGHETYGEDPYLTATLAVAYITGMQGPNPDLPDVIATPKHFAVHSGPEPTRHTDNFFVTPHDLEDTYLPAFRAAIVDAKAGSIMCAYNRVDGLPACASGPLMKDTLRGAWGFQGYVVSDCDAVTDIDEKHKFSPDGATAVAASLKAGVDNECHTGYWSKGKQLLQRYKDARARGLISDADIDLALVRLFSARIRNGDLPGFDKPAVPATEIDTPAHRALALKSAVKSLVLLKNDGALPLKANARIAVIGPLADSTRVLRGNYSSERTGEAVSILEGLRQAMPKASIKHVPFTASITDGDPVPASAFVTPDGKPGLRAEYFNAVAEGSYEAQPKVTRIEPYVVSNAALMPEVSGRHKVVWTGFLVAPESGSYRLGLSALKGKVDTGGEGVGATAYSGWNDPPKLTDVVLEKGHRYAVRLETEPGVGPHPGLLWKRVTKDLDAELKAAVAKADVVVAAVGLTPDIEGEEMPVAYEGFSGGDRTAIELPADQRRLLEAAKALGKPVVVVLMNGGALGLGWAKQNAAAILETWYPGQAGGRAVGQVLAGAADPGGRLPLTFYGSVTDLPAFNDYSMNGRTYRYFTGAPVYPFGHGLSYTSFAYGALKVDAAGDAPEKGLRVTAEVRNTGRRAGDEVVQLYITPPGFSGAPRLALRGAQRVTLEPGKSQQVTFELSPRDLSFVTAEGQRRLVPGQYQVSVGSGQPGAGVAAASAAYTIQNVVDLPQ